MLKNTKPKLIAIFIIILIIAGTVRYVQYLINKPLDIEIPKHFVYNNTKIALAWTDDNTGENLIIQSDKKNYYGFSSAEIYFSITNTLRRDQDMDIVIWLPSEKSKAEKVERINKDGSNFEFPISNFESISNDLMNKFSNRKDVGGSDNGYAANDKIESGETNYYKATIKYPPMSKGEFFIEAFGCPFVISNGAERREKSLEHGKTVNVENKTFKGFLANARNDKIAYGHLDPWYSSSWSYRRQVTLQSSQIATTTSAFPVLATTTLADLRTTTNGGKVGNDNGYDIVFTDTDGETVLNFEREKYASTTGEIVYWIKTDISSITNKTIYMYYGNSGASDLATTTGVWDDNYKGVWHMNQDPSTASTTDSTLNNNDGTSGGSMTSADLVNGQTGKAIDFDGADDLINCGKDSSLNGMGPLTWEAWIYPRSRGEGVNDAPAGRIINKLKRFFMEDIGGGGRHIGLTAVTSPLTYRVSNDYINYNTQWHHVVATWDGVNNCWAINFYIDGVLRNNGGGGSGTKEDDSAYDLIIGNVIGQTYTFDGLIDEVRVSSIVRSANWITTEYNNQSDVASFMTFGAEETLKLDITTSAQVLTEGTESGVFTVQAQNSSGDAMDMGNNVTVNLASDSSGTYHFASTTAGTAISSVTIPSGSNSVNFYYTDHKAGAPTITVQATNFTSDTQQQMVQGVWYNTGYQCRRQITLDADQISTTTSAFPVLATSTLAEMATVTHGGCVQNDSGHDIIFVDDDNTTLLNFEREKYASTTGEIAYWIKTDISSTTDKTIYMYYGSSTSSDQATTTGVWDDNFVMVNHLAHDGVATTTYPDFLDSTKYDNDGSSKNMNSDDLVDGQIDGALDFDGADDYVSCGNQSSLQITGDVITISTWIKSDSLLTGQRVVSKWGTGNWAYLLQLGASGKITFSVFDDDGGESTETSYASYTTNWTHIIGIYDGAKQSIYINGEIDPWSPKDNVGNILPGGKNVVIGYEGAIEGTTYFNGIIDEVRIS
ncbi:DUF2341 domain-containing protein, partial [Candidatus Parcubacteria bacterium]|nr:DUF2341 domain-containing protein [Candidatus Parcubacteria bacterium]